MAIEFQCNRCGKTLRVQDKHAGRSVKCPECTAKLRVPQEDDHLFDDDGFEDWGMEDGSAPPPRRPKESKPRQPKPKRFVESPPPRSVSTSSGGGGELSGGDWVLIVLCGNIACLVGIIACLSGDTDRGVKMIVYPIVLQFGLGLILGAMQAVLQN